MKPTDKKSMNSFKSELFILLLIFISLLGVSIKASAQSPTVGTDHEVLENSMKLQVNGSNFSVIIPKVKFSELTAFTELTYDQLLYVSDKEVGFYQFRDDKWSKVSVMEALKTIKSNLELATPSNNNIILNGSFAANRNYLDYNSHVKELGEVFKNNPTSKNFAINLKH